MKKKEPPKSFIGASKDSHAAGALDTSLYGPDFLDFSPHERPGGSYSNELELLTSLGTFDHLGGENDAKLDSFGGMTPFRDFENFENLEHFKNIETSRKKMKLNRERWARPSPGLNRFQRTNGAFDEGLFSQVGKTGEVGMVNSMYYQDYDEKTLSEILENSQTEILRNMGAPGDSSFLLNSSGLGFNKAIPPNLG